MKTFDISKCDINIFKLSRGRGSGVFRYQGVMVRDCFFSGMKLYGKEDGRGHLLEAKTKQPVQGASHLSFDWGDGCFRVAFSCPRGTEERWLGIWRVGSGVGPRWKEGRALIPQRFGLSSAT